MSTKGLKVWVRIHSWTSLISTLFLLILFVTGLPLIFRGEINHALGYADRQAVAGETLQPASVDAIVQAGIEHYPGEVVQYVVWEKDMPGIIMLAMGKAPDADFMDNHNVLVDAYTAKIIDDTPEPLDFFVTLHTQLFTGRASGIILGLISVLFLLALISGFVIYGPFMKKQKFGHIRKTKLRKTKWLDFHNMIGVIVFGWALVVGGTGLVNSWGQYLFMYWRYDQLAEMVIPYKGQPIATDMVSLDIALEEATKSMPDMEPYFLAYPQSFVSSDYHYAVFMRGTTPRTESMIQPALIDASTGVFTDSREMPNYMKTLYLSQPLHFGDYGGLPLKIIWLLFDLATIFILLTGIYLWMARRKVFSKSKALDEQMHGKQGI